MSLNAGDGHGEQKGPDTMTGHLRAVASSHLVSCDVWHVQQLAAGGRWNTLLAEYNQSDAERAVERLAKSGERNLRIQVQRAANASAQTRPATKLP